MSKLSNALILLVSVILVFLGLMFIIGAVFNPYRVIPGFLMFLLGLGGIYYLFKVRRRAALPSWLESEVIRLAEDEGGVLTVSKVSAELNIPVELAKKVLDNLARKGGCHSDFEEIERVGVEVYRFPGVHRES